MNKTLLRKVQKDILDYPEKLNMDTWIEPTKSGRVGCGTACCIGGWAMVEKGYKAKKKRNKDGELWTQYIKPNGTPTYEDEDEATKVLQLTHSEAQRLFFTGHWPEEFRAQYNSIYPLVRAANAVARIEHFIQTNGAE